jgi:hypothetical protein
LGREIEAITLHANSDGTTEALSNNYIKVRVTGEVASNELLRVRVGGLTEDGLVATRVAPTALALASAPEPTTAVVG